MIGESPRSKRCSASSIRPLRGEVSPVVENRAQRRQRRRVALVAQGRLQQRCRFRVSRLGLIGFTLGGEQTDVIQILGQYDMATDV